MKTFFSLVCLLFCLTANVWAVQQSPLNTATKQVTKTQVCDLALKLASEVTPQLSPGEKASLDNIRFTLESQRKIPSMHTGSINELVNASTVALAANKAIVPVMATAAMLFQEAPESERTANLLGVVLHAIDRNQDAISFLAYAHSLNSKNTLIMLNMANVFLDLDQDEKAKKMLDSVLSIDQTNKSAYSTLACYYFKKRDFNKAMDALVRAAKFGGIIVHKKEEENHKVVEENTAKEADSTKTIEKKLEQMNTLVPKTTADLIEAQFPDIAHDIRDRYGRLMDVEKMKMPPLPQVNTSGVANWLSKGQPYIDQWLKAFKARKKEGMLELAHLGAGVNKGDSKKLVRQKEKAAAREKLKKGLADADAMLKQLEGMPGITDAQLAKARHKMDQAMAKQGIKSSPEAELRTPKAIMSDEDASKIGADEVPVGYDYGGVFSVSNFRDYISIRDSYLLYFRKYYFQEMIPTIKDIILVYHKKTDEEKAFHKDEMEKIQKVEDDARIKEGVEKGLVPENIAKKIDLERRKENLRYKKAMNALADDFFEQWANVALPQYTKKMKPKLDEFWAVSALYIRNMNQPEVMKQAYIDTKTTFWSFASAATDLMTCKNVFRYMGDTEEEARQLQEEIRASEEEAKEKVEDYKQGTSMAEAALDKWIDDNFAVRVAGEFLSLRISPRTLVVEEYVAGINFKHVFDFKTGLWTTYRSLAAKLDIGIELGPVQAGVSVSVDLLESYDTLNLRNGQVMESGSRFGQIEGKVSGKVGPAEAEGTATVKLDPVAGNKVSAEANASFSASEAASQIVP